MKRLSFVLGFLLLNLISNANSHTVLPIEPVVITESCACELYVPNIFSPNNDGANDFFLPATNCILEDYTFSVYNRWGQLLFQTTNPSQGWDGRAKNELAAHDTYIYSIEYRFAEFPDPLVEYGSVALIR